MQQHEVRLASDSYKTRREPVVVNPLGGSVRLGLITTRPAVPWLVRFTAYIVNMHNDSIEYISDQGWIQRYIIGFIVQNDERGVDNGNYKRC